MTATKRDRRDLVIVAVVTAVLVGALLTVNLSVHHVPWGNERDGYFLIGTIGADEILSRHPVGAALVMKGLNALTGDVFVAGHVVAAICAWLFLILAFALVRRLFGSPVIAALSVLAVFVLPSFIRSTLLCTTDMLFQVITLAAFGCFIELFHGERSNGKARLTGGLLALAAMIKVLGAFAWLGALAALWLDASRKESRLKTTLNLAGSFMVVFLTGVLLGQLLLVVDASKAVGLRIPGFGYFVRWFLFQMLEVPLFDFGERPIAAIFSHAGPILFRIAANLIERSWGVLISLAVVPAVAFIVTLLRERRRDLTASGWIITVFLLIVFHLTMSFQDLARYFLFFTPIIFGCFYFSLAQAMASLSSPRRWIGQLLSLIVALLVIVVLVVNSVVSVRTMAVYYDWETEGNRPHLSSAEIEQAMKVLRGEVDRDAVFAGGNAAFGLSDLSFWYYDRIHSEEKSAGFIRENKSVSYYHADLQKFLCIKKVRFYLHDGHDVFLGIRWSAYETLDDPEQRRYAPRFLVPERKVGMVEIYRVTPSVCEFEATSSPEPVAPAGPPPADFPPPGPPPNPPGV